MERAWQGTGRLGGKKGRGVQLTGGQENELQKAVM